jgi:mannose-6-phosphate isomerase-like protein (cupin superfamily)
MKVFRSSEFRGSRAWDARDIANMRGITTRLHWTDAPYRWHVNDGEEVFVVLSGEVRMKYRDAGAELEAYLRPGDIFYAGVGTEHVAHPVGECRILVVEHEGSL